MPSIPLEINREEILSLLNSVSSVRALRLLNLYRHGSFWKRVGLVEVSDKESVFRLTSRQFLLRGYHAVKHKMISSDSFLVKEFGNLDIRIHLNFYSRDPTAVIRVVDFLEQFGSLNIISTKSRDGNHELFFRAAKDYSIRLHCTDLKLRVDEIIVEIYFPEEKINADNLDYDETMLHELDLFTVELSKPFVPISEYFDPTDRKSVV